MHCGTCNQQQWLLEQLRHHPRGRAQQPVPFLQLSLLHRSLPAGAVYRLRLLERPVPASTSDLAAALAQAAAGSASTQAAASGSGCGCASYPSNCGQNNALCAVCPSLCRPNGNSCGACGGCGVCGGCGQSQNGCQMCYGVFTANGTINITAGATVPLEARNTNANCFSDTNGTITVLEPGLYLAILSVDTPSNAAVDTTIQLQVDGQVLVPPRLVIDTVANATINNYTGAGVFCARAGSNIQVTTSAALNVTGTAGQPVVSLTLIRLQ